MRRVPKIIIALLLLGLTASQLASARSNAAATPQVHGQKMRDFVRLTFEWPEQTLFTAKTSGNDVIITFDRKAKLNMGTVLKQLHPYVTKAEKKGDGKTIILTLDKPHRIRTFISDNVSGIDLLDLKGALPPSKKTKMAKKSSAKPQIVAKKKAKTETQTAANELGKLTPAAGEPEAPKAAETPKASEAPKAEEPKKPEAAATGMPAPVAAVKPEEKKQEAVAVPAPALAPAAGAATPAPVVPEAPKEEAKKETPKAEEPKKEEAKKEPPKPVSKEPVVFDEEKKDAATTHSHSAVSMVPMPVDQAEDMAVDEKEAADKKVQNVSEVPVATTTVESSEQGATPAPLASNKIVVSADADSATLRFPLKQRTAMAVFTRVNALWVVFDRKLDFDMIEFDNLPQTIIGKATVVPNDKVTVLRIPISDNIYPAVKQEAGQLDIALLLTTQKRTIDAPMEVSVNTEPPAPAHVFIPALEAASSVEITDPDVGDTMLVVPIFTREQGITGPHNFVEFSLLPSTQGIAIVKKADNTEVTLLRNGLRVSLPKGAAVSQPLDGAKPQEDAAVPATSGTFFPDQLWKLEKDQDPKIAMRKLFNQTVFAANEGAKNLARLRMAQLYLRDGFMVEAIGLLDTINRTSPSYYRSAKLAAMRGAANFLLYRFNDAARDFNSTELNNNPEATYWRDMLADLLGSPNHSYDFMAMNDNYMSKYPAVFRQRLAIVAADRAIAGKEYNTALKIFDTLTKDKIIAPIQPYVDFLTAKISSDTGKQEDAVAVWKKLAESSPDPFVQARAKFSVILADLDNNTITREQAADKLERLRLSWHGDGLELQIVQLLGDLYYEKQDYVNAMRVWNIGVTGFKNTGPAIEMARHMEDTFIKLFNEGTVEKMKPLEALALYYQYRNYTPAGLAGTQMIEKLADRLVGVDLLPTATQLLEQQMRTQMEKSERSRIGAKLAGVYLLNNQPKKALKTLQDSVYGDNPILQRLQRNRLAARALMELGKPDEALTVLGQDENIEAAKIRSMIYWQQKDWPNIANSIEAMLKQRPDPSAALTQEEGEFVLRLALAYVFEHEPEQLKYMRDYFGPLMKGNVNQQAFDFITTPDINPNTRNFDDLLDALSRTRGFITNYKAHMEMAEAQ